MTNVLLGVPVLSFGQLPMFFGGGECIIKCYGSYMYLSVRMVICI